MSKNPLYDWFAKHLKSDEDSLSTGKNLSLSQYNVKLASNVIIYHPKSEQKKGQLRFAFLGKQKGSGLFGDIMRIDARITPTGLRFPGDKGKTYCAKQFKSRFPASSQDARDKEFAFAEKLKLFHAKRTGRAADTRFGMMMRDFGEDNLTAVLRAESCTLIKVMSRRVLSNFDPEELYDTVYLYADKLSCYDSSLGFSKQIIPQTLQQQVAYYELKKILQDKPESDRRYFSGPRERRCIEILRGLPEGSMRPMSLKLRLELTLNLFKALRDQVAAYGFSHNDLKTENIIVNKNTGEMYIIDFGLSMDLGALITNFRGAPLYSSPEMIRMHKSCTRHLNSERDIIGPESDLYSAGKLAAEIWGVDNDAWGFNVPQVDSTNNNGKVLDTLFLRLDEPPPKSIQDRIRAALTSILYFDPQMRASADQLIDTFEEILKDYLWEAEDQVYAGLGMGVC